MAHKKNKGLILGILGATAAAATALFLSKPANRKRVTTAASKVGKRGASLAKKGLKRIKSRGKK